MSVEFSYRAHHSYKEYLSQQYLMENMDFVIDKNLREAVGSIGDIYKHGVQEIKNSIDDNFEVVTFNLEQISGTLDVINSNLVTGFQALFVKAEEISTSLAHLNRGIDELVEIARTPTETWALNQYEIARDLVRRRLYPEALEALDLAINGKDQQVGYRSDYRFHYLRGVVLSGIPGEPESRDVINLLAAEEAFGLAVRYARHDHRTEAALALVGAGRAAYADMRQSDAEKYYAGALQLDGECGEAHYQIGRTRSELGDLTTAEKHLCKAFDTHWSFAMRAATDPLFCGDTELNSLVRRCIGIVSENIANEVGLKLSTALRAAESIETKQLKNHPITGIKEYAQLQDKLKSIIIILRKRSLQTVYEMRSQLNSTINDVRSALQVAVKKYCDALESARHRITSERTPEDALEKSRATGLFWGLGIMLITLASLSIAILGPNQGNLTLVIFLVLVGLSIIWAVGMAAAGRAEQRATSRHALILDKTLTELRSIGGL